MQVGEEGGAAFIRIDVIHLDHPARQDSGQRRRDRELGTLALTAPRPIGGLDPGVDRDGGMVR